MKSEGKEYSATSLINSLESKEEKTYDYKLSQITQFGSPKDIRILLFIGLFKFNMEELERYIRYNSDKKCSIKNKMKPYKKVYDKIRPLLEDPVKKFTLCNVSEGIRDSLHSLLAGVKPVNPNVYLINIYNSQTSNIETQPLF